MFAVIYKIFFRYGKLAEPYISNSYLEALKKCYEDQTPCPYVS